MDRMREKRAGKRLGALTVTRMRKGNGCPITDEEARVIIDYILTIRGPAAR
ncbi:MAG TPA: hypothetical protein VJ307_10205 [Candidatus Deferrimicrobiaceae bacterium]|jgi:hypothetical protein|nr:hypothetical protein [Candidatus Deferrimicrobiaceae bacterium]